MSGQILVTGADGFVGRHLRVELGERFRDADVDVTDTEAVARVVAGMRPAAVVHLAALTSVEASWRAAAEVWRVNVLGTVNVLEAVAAHAPAARTVVASSGEVYGRAERSPTTEDEPPRPLSPYAASKAAAEVACERALRVVGTDVVVVRPFGTIGPGQDERFAVGSWTRQVARLERTGGGTLRVGDVSAARDLVDVRDAARAYRLLVEPSVSAATYNLATGRAVKLDEIVRTLLELSRHAIDVEVDASRLRPSDVPLLSGDPTRMARATGWRPEIPIRQTLEDALEHARNEVNREGSST